MLKRPEKKLTPFSNSRCASALPRALAPAVKSRSLQAKGKDGPEDAWHRVAHVRQCWCHSGRLAPIYWATELLSLLLTANLMLGESPDGSKSDVANTQRFGVAGKPLVWVFETREESGFPVEIRRRKCVCQGNRQQKPRMASQGHCQAGQFCCQEQVRDGDLLPENYQSRSWVSTQ